MSKLKVDFWLFKHVKPKLMKKVGFVFQKNIYVKLVSLLK